MRSFHFPGRSPVYASRAMCATSHPLATSTAIDVLRGGGNAVDAAVAATAVQCVVEPAMTGIGGDCFAMVAKPTGEIIALNASGRAPAAANCDWYADQGISSITRGSAHAVTVPGAIDGWSRLVSDHGTRSLQALLQPAIGYARDGFPVAPRVALDWMRGTEKLGADPGARIHFLFEGQPPRVGQVVRMPALADTLQAIAEGGRDAFYAGPIAADMVSELQASGGLHTLDDFAGQTSQYVTPITVSYGGLKVHELPPNNQGVVALQILRILERLGRISDDPGAARRYHVMIEVARQAYAVRDALLGDPDMADVDVDHMLRDDVIDTLAARIDLDRRAEDLGPVPRPAGSDTVYLSVVDADGMAVSFINSLFADFGSGIVTTKTGIVLHNRGEAFRLEPGHPNGIAPGKRPLHTLVPALATKDDKLAMSFGVMGGAFQPVGHAYVLSNICDYGMDPQEALDFPRVFFEGEAVEIEDSVPQETRESLSAMGHQLAVRSIPWGGGQIIAVDPVTGSLIGGSDARKDGCAIGY
ncbi:MAG: gamma-glutamyltransferase [Pseudomonadota bacterium]